MAIGSTYCTHRDLKDIYPNIDEFDSKSAIYGWELGLTDAYDSTIDAYYANNTGLVTNLFWDGAKLSQLKTVDSTTSNKTTTTGSVNSDATQINVASSTGLDAGDIIKVNDEYIKISSIISSTRIGTVLADRGLFGTTAIYHEIGSGVKLIIDASLSIQDADSASDGATYIYDTFLDLCVIFVDTKNPADYLIESGEDFNTLITRITKNASRYVDSRVDANIPRDAFKDKEGNYDYFLVRTTALASIHFLVNSHTPGSELADSFMEEVNFNIDQINTGKTKLSYQVSGDSASGVLREVTSPQNSNGLYIVDTRGYYSGVYDLIKIIISTGGAIGTARFDVYHGDDSGLKQNKVIDSELITGKYQSVGSGLQVRFSGSNDSSEATANDEWELECWGVYESLDDSPGSGTNTRLTRRTY